VLLAAVLLVVGLVALFDQGVGPLPDPEGCHATVGGLTVDLSTEQAENASLISAIAVRRGMPARAASIALATAFQESKLRNLDHGDRDSVGLFQQRPSQGWGSARQLQDPYYAINRFYDALVRIDGYQQMRITEAAQKVQRSGFPEAYEAHAPDGRALASALTGYSPGRFSCVVHASKGDQREKPTANGLTPRAERVSSDLAQAFGALAQAPDGRSFDVQVGSSGDSGAHRGWAVASYLVAHASRLHVAQVRYDGRRWAAGRHSERGWLPDRSATGTGVVRVAVVAGN
jgi:plasmid stabilization system protein ParE